MPVLEVVAGNALAMETLPSSSINGDVRRATHDHVPDISFRTTSKSNGSIRTESINSLPANNDPPQNPVPVQAYISVAILCFINLINYMDRFTVAGVLMEIKKYYGIDNRKGGLLQTVFICSYMVFAPLFGYLGDRYSRKAIICFGILFWSGTTLAGSFIDSSHFGAFMALRGMVGIGEASYSTLAPTIISDLFVGKRRSNTLAIFYFAIPVGSGLGYIIGSKVSSALGHWQWSLRVTPALGVVAILLLFFFLKEPNRGASEGGEHLGATDWKTDLKALSKNLSFIWSTLGFTCVAFVVGALAWWGPNFMTLGYWVHGDNIAESNVDLIFGVITCVAGFVGVAMGSTISTFLKKKWPNADPLVCGVGMLLGTPFLFIAAVMADTNSYVSWIWNTRINFHYLFLNSMLLFPQEEVWHEAVQMVASHALGDAISPYIIGLISDAIKSGDTATHTVKFKSLQYAMFLTTFVSVIGGLCFLFSALYIVRDKNRAMKLTQGKFNFFFVCVTEDADSIGEGLSPVVMTTDDVHPLIT
ncbi:Protein spinster 1 [Nymphon striatum]|nr:Protein spinster 1 [Nymphon striatum]